MEEKQTDLVKQRTGTEACNSRCRRFDDCPQGVEEDGHQDELDTPKDVCNLRSRRLGSSSYDRPHGIHRRYRRMKLISRKSVRLNRQSAKRPKGKE